MCEEAFEHGRWIGLYWSATGHAHRENVALRRLRLAGRHRSTEYFAKVRRYIGLHKGFCRPVLAGHPVVHHHMPDIGLLTPAEWCVLEYACPDRSRGYAGVFRLLNGAGEYRLLLRGVDAGAEYQVTLDNAKQTFRISGRELALAGLPITLDSALTSELVMYERCR